jgi:hypothetical protein
MLRIVGGASLPARVGALNVSWPFAVLVYGDEGISVDLQPRLLKRALQRITKDRIRENAIEDAWWSSTWAELSLARLATRSVILTNIQKESCKFVTVTRESMEPLILELEQRRIAVQRVKNNFSYTGGDR